MEKYVDNLGARLWLDKVEEDIKRVEMIKAFIKGSTILDLGCGDGAISIELAREGYRVFSVNNNEKEIFPFSRFYNKEPKEVRDRITMIIGDIERCHVFEILNKEKIDTILLCEVLEHVDSPEEIMNAISFFHGSDLIVTVPNYHVDDKKYASRWRLGAHIRNYTKEVLYKFLSRYLEDIEFVKEWDDIKGDEWSFLICTGIIK